PLVSTLVTIRRMSALSSATTTRGLGMVVVMRLLYVLEPVSSGGDRQLGRRLEDRAQREQHNQTLVDPDDRLDHRQVGAGRLLDLIFGDGENLLHAVHAHTG